VSNDTKRKFLNFLINHISDILTICLVATRLTGFSAFENIIILAIMANASYELNLIQSFYGIKVPTHIKISQALISIILALALEDFERSIFFKKPNEILYIIALFSATTIPPLICLRGLREASDYMNEFSLKVIRVWRGWKEEDSWKNYMDHVGKSKLIVPLTYYLISVLIILLPSLVFAFIYTLYSAEDLWFYISVGIYLLYRFGLKEKYSLEGIMKPVLLREEIFSLQPIIQVLFSISALANINFIQGLRGSLTNSIILVVNLYIIFYSIYLENLLLSMKETGFAHPLLSIILSISILVIGGYYSFILGILPILIFVAVIRFIKGSKGYNWFIIDSIFTLMLLIIQFYVFLGVDAAIILILAVLSGIFMELGLKRTYVLLAPASIPLPFMFLIINARSTAFALLFLAIIATIIFLYMIGRGIMKTTLEKHKEIHKGRIL